MMSESDSSVVAKKSFRVMPSAAAILSSDPIDGETCPFSSWEIKLAENAARSANALTESPAASRNRFTSIPICASIFAGTDTDATASSFAIISMLTLDRSQATRALSHDDGSSVVLLHRDVHTGRVRPVQLASRRYTLRTDFGVTGKGERLKQAVRRGPQVLREI